MVGLYHKRRAQRSHSKVLGFFTKALMTLGLMVVIAFVLIVLFFNGSQIKKPLSSYLSAQTGFEVTIGDAEFSPLYPDVIKLYDVRFGNSKIGELYLEYDLRSALSDERLEINDLYLNGLTITPEDLQQLKAQRLGYHSIYASLVRFHHTPVQTTFLHAQDTTIRLNAVGFDPEHGLTFRSGALAATQAQLFAREVKDLSLQFEHQGEGLTIKNFSAAMLGGMVSGTGHYLPHERTAQRANTNGLSSTAGLSSAASLSSAEGFNSNTGFNSAEGLSSNGAADLIFDELNLSKIILHDTLRPSAGINLKATKVNLSQVVYTNDAPAPTASDDSASKAPAASASKAATDNQSDAADKATAAADSSSPRADGSSAYHSMVMQGISGQLYDLKLSHNEFSARFEGEIDALSFPNLQTSFEHNKGSANLSRDLVSFDFKGQLYEGNYELTGSLDPAAQELTVEALKLERAKLALNPPRLDFLTHANSYTLKLKQAQFTNLEFLSFLNQFPVSIQSISGTAHDLVWAGATQKLSAPTPATLLYPIRAEHGALKLKLDNLLYSNLLFSEIAFEGELSSQQLQFKLPQVTMKESNWSAQGALSLTDLGQSSLNVTAENFESADLNSNLIGHMLTGKVNLSAQLTSSFEGWNQVLGDTLAATTTDAGRAKPLGLKSAFLRNLNGSVRLGSEGLLISDFGLDLINGGKQQDYTLSGTELLAALQGSVAGINALEADTTFQAGKLSTRGRVGLATANASFSVNIDLLDHDFSGNAFMVSLGNDSTTTVSFDGTTAEPQFAIRALKRGANRPGLYLPQYDAMAQAKEQTDAKGVLNGTIAVEEPSMQPEQISERTVDNAASTATAPEANEEAEQAAAESAHAEAATTSSAESAAESTTDEGTAESATEPAADSGVAESNEEEEQAPASDAREASAAAPDAEAQAPDEPEANTPATAETNQPENAHAEDSATSTAESAAEPTTDEGTAESATEPAADAGGSEANKEEEQAPSSDASAANAAAPAAEAQAPAEPEANTPATAETNTPESVHAEDTATSTAESAAEPATDESVAEANEEEEQAPTSDARAASTAAPTEEAQAPNETEANNPAAAETNTPDNAHAEAAAPNTAESGAAPAADAGVAETNESTEQSADTGASAASAAPDAEAQAPNETEANNPATAETNTPDNAHAEAAAPSSAESGAAPAADAADTQAAERAAQAQADATEYELLKDVFIDSFIQHEHGTTAEEEAANAAAKKQRAEHPYDPEEELIF